MYEALGDFRDSAVQAKRLRYRIALALLEEGNYAQAQEAFLALGDYEDDAERCREAAYQLGMQKKAEGSRLEALQAFLAAEDHKDTFVQLQEVYAEFDRLIAAAGLHSAAVCADGTVVVVGEDFEGSNNVHEWRNVVAIDAKSDLTMGLMMDAR